MLTATARIPANCVRIYAPKCAPALGAARLFPSSRMPVQRKAANGDEEKPAGGSDGGEAFESLFSKELQRRGLSMDSLDDDTAQPKKASSSAADSSATAGTNPFRATSSTSETRQRARPRAPPPPMAEGQRERSIELVNEGLEGLPGRASQLLQLGASAFLPFLPFMLAFSILFSLIFFVFGDSFLHGGRPGQGLPAYVDPQTLLSEPTVDPYVPYSDFRN